MRAGDAHRPSLPSTLPPGDRSVDRATQGRDFDALVRSEDAPPPTGEAMPQTQASAAAIRSRIVPDSGQPRAVPAPAQTSDSMTGTPLPDVAVPSLPSMEVGRLATAPCKNAAVTAAEPSDTPSSDTLAPGVQGDAAVPPIPALPVAPDSSPLMPEQRWGELAEHGEQNGDVKQADADGVETTKASKAACAAPTSSHPSSQHLLSTSSLVDVPAMPMAALHASPPAAAIAGMGVAFPKVMDSAPGDFSVSPSPSATTTSMASVDTLVPDLAVEVARHAAIGREEFLLRLRPADHGTILVRLQFQGDGPLRATITADNMAVLDMLRRDSDALASNLADAGVQTDARSFHFSGGDGGQAEGSIRSPFTTKRASRSEGSGDDGIDETIALYRPLRARAGMVNRLA